MYFLTILASLSDSTIVPRALRTNLAERLIMPWRLPCAATFTLPVPVILKRFLAPLLVFNLGIWSAPFGRGPASHPWGAYAPLRRRGRLAELGLGRMPHRAC